MSAEAYETGMPQFKDRSTGLFVFGFLQIAMGFFAAMMVPLLLISAAMGPGAAGGATTAQMIPAAGFYVVIAIVAVWLGVGSIRPRRWARALTLVLAWMWLIFGVMTLVIMAVWMPNMADLMAAQGQKMPPQALAIMQIVMFGTMGCMYVVLPGIFVAFYQRADVKATCELKDPEVRWTDRCPLPVLSLSLLLAFGATSVIASAGYGYVVPVFGFLVKGAAGAMVYLGFSLLFGYLAWSTYKMRKWAWWATLGSCLFLGLSSVVSFSQIGLMDYYREMNFPEDQLQMMEDTGVLDMNIPLAIGINMAVFVGYLIWVKGYWVTTPDAEQES